MPDSKAAFSVAKRKKQVIRRHSPHIAQSGTRCTHNRCFRSGRVPFLFVTNTNYRAGNLWITAHQSDFCHPRAKCTFNTCTNKFARSGESTFAPNKGEV